MVCSFALVRVFREIEVSPHIESVHHQHQYSIIAHYKQNTLFLHDHLLDCFISQKEQSNNNEASSRQRWQSIPHAVSELKFQDLGHHLNFDKFTNFKPQHQLNNSSGIPTPGQHTQHSDVLSKIPLPPSPPPTPMSTTHQPLLPLPRPPPHRLPHHPPRPRSTSHSYLPAG
jgi:hypothetical protein